MSVLTALNAAPPSRLVFCIPHPHPLNEMNLFAYWLLFPVVLLYTHDDVWPEGYRSPWTKDAADAAALQVGLPVFVFPGFQPPVTRYWGDV